MNRDTPDEELRPSPRARLPLAPAPSSGLRDPRMPWYDPDRSSSMQSLPCRPKAPPGGRMKLAIIATLVVLVLLLILRGALKPRDTVIGSQLTAKRPERDP